MAKDTDQQIAELEEKRREIENKIKKKRDQKREQKRKERNSRLIQWGIVVENLLGDPNKKFSEKFLADLCYEYLSESSLKRALTGPLEPFAEQRDQGKSDQSKQPQQQTQNQTTQDKQQGETSGRTPPPQS